MKANLILAASALALAACASDNSASTMGSGRGPAAADAAAMNPTPTDAKSYVMMAGAGDLYEIQSSQLAQQKSQSQPVKDFAAMLIAHHTQTTQTLMAAAMQAGMSPAPPKLMPMQAQMIEQLRQASASTFDGVYKQQQIEAHQMALQLHQNYAQNGDTPALKGAAASAVPIIQQHLTAAQSLPM